MGNDSRMMESERQTDDDICDGSGMMMNGMAVPLKEDLSSGSAVPGLGRGSDVRTRFPIFFYK